MGSLVSGVADLNPLSVAKSISHDFFVYVANACESQCDCCSCWKLSFKSEATHDDAEPAPSRTIDWH